jgi:hypothetical protein
MKQIEKYKGLLDMINGGGANAEGDKFEGGGLLSILANALATPYGSEDRAEEAASLLGNTRPQMRPNRPASIAPAAPAQGMSLNAGPAMPRMPTDPKLALPGNPSKPIDDGLGPMPQRLQGDPNLGFNPANAAPVQPSAPAYTPHSSIDFRPSDFEVRPVPTEHYDTFLRRFEQRVGPEMARDYPAQLLERVYIDYAINGDQFSQ